MARDPLRESDPRKAGFARELFNLRFRRLRLSQRAFAQRYGLGYPTIRDLEQGVTRPTRAMRLVVAAIALDPLFMRGAAAAAREQGGEPDRSTVPVITGQKQRRLTGQR